MFFTALAIVLPDTAQLQLPFEVVNFWVQHYALLLLPLYMLLTHRFPISPAWAVTSYSIGIGMGFHFLAQLPAALLSGVNVNYMLWPPPGVPDLVLLSKHHRIYLTMVFVPLAWLTGFALPKLVLSYRDRNAKKKNKITVVNSNKNKLKKDKRNKTKKQA